MAVNNIENKNIHTDNKADYNKENERIRNKALHRNRCRESAKRLVTKPLNVKNILVLLWLVALIAALSASGNVIDDVATGMSTSRSVAIIENIVSTFTEEPIQLTNQTAITCFVIGVILIVASVFLLGIFYFLAWSLDFKEIDNDVATGLKIKKEYWYTRPFLISKNIVSANNGLVITDYVFWSRWIPITTWNKEEYLNAILSALGVHLVEPIRHGGKDNNDSHIIVLRVGLGAKPVPREAPVDRLFS